jgi:predicted GH43/DUF377 family glycosyl hydrolase
MIEVKKEGVLLNKTTLGFEIEGVLNPAAIREDDCVHLFYRAVAKGNYSSIGYSKLKGALVVEERHEMPVLFPQFKYELHGMEDPRIVKIEDLYYLTYTAYDGENALGALATSKDLKQFTKHGIITPKFSYHDYDFCVECCKGLNEKYLRFYKLFKERAGAGCTLELLVWDKDVTFFPKKINGRFAFLHRLYPGIQIAYFDKLDDLNEKFWRDYLFHLRDFIVMESKYPFEASYIGGGCPPIETSEGWLLIYHGVEDTPQGYIYHAGAALLDIRDPTKEISRLKYPLFSPTEKWEKEGVVKNVVFPTGATLYDDRLYIYYGAADDCIACVSVSLSMLLAELLNNSIKDDK